MAARKRPRRQPTPPSEALSELDPAQRVTLVSFAEAYKRLDRSGWLLRVAARTQSVAMSVVLQ